METLRPFLDQKVKIEISGNETLRGKLIDVGSDIIV